MTVSTCFLKLGTLDDGVLAGERSAVLRALQLNEELGPHLGINLNFSKCEACLVGGGGISLFPPVVKSSLLPNLVILGVPIGDFVHCARFIAEKCAISKVLLKALVDVSVVDLHVAFSLLRMCGSYCNLVHLTRATPPSLCADSLKSFDEDIRLVLLLVLQWMSPILTGSKHSSAHVLVV